MSEGTGPSRLRPRLTPRARLESNSVIILVEGKLDAKLYRYLVYAVATRCGLSCRYCEADNTSCSANYAHLADIVGAVAPGYIDEARRWIECSTESGRGLVAVVVPVNGYGNVISRVKAICEGTAASRIYIGIVDGDDDGPQRRTQRLLRELHQSCRRAQWDSIDMLCDTAIMATHVSGNIELYLAVQGLGEEHPLRLTPGNKAEIEDYVPLIMEELGLDPHKVLECMNTIQGSPHCGTLQRCNDSKTYSLTAQLLYCATNPMSLPDTLAKTCDTWRWRRRLTCAVYNAFRRASPCIVEALRRALLSLSAFPP